MFGYRHAFHAGNYADVLKHTVLIELLNNLNKKDKPYWVLDTHAGIGAYQFDSFEAQKTKEYVEGIGRIWDKNIPSLHDYLEALMVANHDLQTQMPAGYDIAQPILSHYAGSPMLIANQVREGDELVACELNAVDCSILKSNFRMRSGVSVHLRDGFEAIKALCPPPKIKRGMVFIDPPYEDKSDFTKIVDAAQYLSTHWHGTIMAIWYPILGQNLHIPMLNSFQASGLKSVLNIELHLASNEIGLGMAGCGMLIVNAPWQFDDWAKNVLKDLAIYLKKLNEPRTVVEWLTPQ